MLRVKVLPLASAVGRPAYDSGGRCHQPDSWIFSSCPVSCSFTSLLCFLVTNRQLPATWFLREMSDFKLRGHSPWMMKQRTTELEVSDTEQLTCSSDRSERKQPRTEYRLKGPQSPRQCGKARGFPEPHSWVCFLPFL